MMIKRLANDSLLLFLALGMVFLSLAFPTFIFNPAENRDYRIVEMDLDSQLEIPKQGGGDQKEIRLLNSALTLLYSVDGGYFFQIAKDDKLPLSSLSNPSIIYSNTSLRWRHPKGDFTELTSVLVKVRDETKGLESKAKALTFYNGYKSDLPLVHITANSAGLFSWQNGIMVYGEESSHDTGFQKDWWYRSANFASRGSDWGRNVQFQFFKKGELQTETACEMKISGNATRYFPQKSLKFKPLDENGRKTKLAYPFWGNEGNKKSTSFLLRQSGNDNGNTFFADLLMHQMASESEVLVQNGFPVSVFINGNYWGIYNFRERIDAYFVGKKEKVKEDEVTILFCEVYGDRTLLKTGSEQEKNDFDALILNLPKDGPISDLAYENLKDKVSIKSFIDYVIFETYYGNQDWLHNNTTWYKAGDKKWKWILNDLDYSLSYPGDQNVNANLFEKLQGGHSITAQLFKALFSHPSFREKFKVRASEIINKTFSDESIDSHFNGLKKQYENDIQLQINRWRFIDSKDSWEKDCNKNVTFLKDRRIQYLKQVEDLE